MAKTTIKIDSNGEWEQMYICTGQSYWISEKICNARQTRGGKCLRCPYRKGGKEDPRKERQK